MLKFTPDLAKTPTEEVTYDFNFRPASGKGLRTGETITGTPTIAATPVTSPALDISSVVVAGDRVQALYKSGVGGTTYHVTVTANTTLSGQPQVRVGCGDLVVAAC